MNCSQADVLIQTGLDGRLSPAERTRLDAHLAHCAACRAAWEDYRRLGRAASDWARPPVPDNLEEVFTAQVMAQIAAGRQSPTPRYSRQVFAGAVFAAVTLAALSFWAGPFLTAGVPLASFLSLPTPEAAGFTDGLRQILSHVPQDAQGGWDALTAHPVPLPGWAGRALAVSLGLNALFAWRARRGTPEAATR